MFVAVICDIGSDDNRNSVIEILKMYGFHQVVENLFESTKIKEESLLRMKRDIDKSTDYYDKIRFYQYPVKDTLVITFLTQKKWKKYVIQQ